MLDDHGKHGIKHPDLGFIKKRKGTSGTINEWRDLALKMKNAKNKGLKGWKLVAAPGYDKRMKNLSPGDILIMPIAPPNHDHGHLMIAMGKAKKGARFSTLDIADSTVNPKGPNDKRRKRKQNKGMGTGTINVRENSKGVLEMEAKCDKKKNPKTCKNGKDWVKLYVVRPV